MFIILTMYSTYLGCGALYCTFSGAVSMMQYHTINTCIFMYMYVCIYMMYMYVFMNNHVHSALQITEGKRTEKRERPHAINRI